MWYLLLYLVFGTIFTISTTIMGHKPRHYVPGFTLIFLTSLLILIVSQSEFFHQKSLEAPLVALLLGLIVGNLWRMPTWLESSLRTEYYIKTGIVLLGATLPLTLIITAGPIAFLQATIVSVTTFLTMFFVATRVFGLDKRFAAVLGAGGSVCGVSASIAVGGAVEAEKEHIAVSISIVSLWALVMIFFLPWPRALGLASRGGWRVDRHQRVRRRRRVRGSSDDRLQRRNRGRHPGIHSHEGHRAGHMDRDLGLGPLHHLGDHMGDERGRRIRAPSGSRNRVGTLPEVRDRLLLASILMSVIVGASSANFDTEITPLLIAPIKTIRTWTFVFTFLCIGLTTRFRDLTKWGMPPFWAFTVGVLVNVPLGFLLSTIVFKDYWMALQ